MSRTLLVVALTLVVASPALAEPEVLLEARPTRVEATVTGGPAGADASRWSLAQVDGKSPIVVQADGVRDSEEPIAIVLLVEGHLMFMGTRSYAEEAGISTDGVHGELGAVVDALRQVGPQGSLGAVVTYAKGAKVLREMGPLQTLEPTVFGIERDYAGNVTRDLVAGVETSIQLLRAATTPRKALIVIGDGAETNVTTAWEQLERLERECAQDRIELFNITYDAGVGDEMVIEALMPVDTASSSTHLPTHAQRIADRISNRIEIGFAAKNFNWDACEHRYQLMLDGQRYPAGAAPIKLGAGLGPCRPKTEESRTWIFVIVGIGFVLAVGGLLFVRRVMRA